MTGVVLADVDGAGGIGRGRIRIRVTTFGRSTFSWSHNLPIGTDRCRCWHFCKFSKKLLSIECMFSYLNEISPRFINPIEMIKSKVNTCLYTMMISLDTRSPHRTWSSPLHVVHLHPEKHCSLVMFCKRKKKRIVGLVSLMARSLLCYVGEEEKYKNNVWRQS